MKKLIIIGLTIILVLTSCQENPQEPIDNKGNSYNSNVAKFIPSFLYDKFISEYDTTNLIGCIYLTKETRDHIYDQPPFTFGGITFYTARGFFLDSLDGDVVLPGDLSINGFAIRPFDSSNYLGADGDDRDDNEFYINFGGENNITNSDGAYLPSFSQNFIIPASVSIANLNVGDTIYKNNPFTFTWSNYQTNCYSGIDLIDLVTENGRGTTHLIQDSGVFTISQEDLARHQTGYALLRVTRFTPLFVKLPNNKRIVIISESRDTRTVYLK